MGPATTALVAWLVSAMTAWSPVDRQHFIAEAQETPAAATTRYNEIAYAIIKVTYDPAHKPFFTLKSDHSRASTALLIDSMAFSESGFRRDVDLGLGKYGRGDGGRSHCMMQIQLGLDRKDTSVLQKIIGRAWNAEDLVNDRVKCFTAGFEMAARSVRQCGSLPAEQRLAAYTRGSCDSRDGQIMSEYRVDKARRWYAAHKPPVTDTAVMAELFPAPAPSAGTSGGTAAAAR